MLLFPAITNLKKAADKQTRRSIVFILLGNSEQPPGYVCPTVSRIVKANVFVLTACFPTNMKKAHQIRFEEISTTPFKHISPPKQKAESVRRYVD
jgi:hypothetical protein